MPTDVTAGLGFVGGGRDLTPMPIDTEIDQMRSHTKADFNTSVPNRSDSGALIFL